MKPNMNDIMKQAQELQQKLQDAQKQLEQMEITGTAGGGLAKVIMTGRYECKKVIISDDLLDEDKSMIEDLIAAAINDAVHKISKETEGRMKQLSGGLNLPAGFGGES